MSAPNRKTSNTKSANICVICSTECSSKFFGSEDSIVQTLLQFYWEVIEIKPPSELKSCSKSMCASCYDTLVEFYDLNDVHLTLKTFLQDKDKCLLQTTIAGIKGLLENQEHLQPWQKRFAKRWVNDDRAERIVTASLETSLNKLEQLAGETLQPDTHERTTDNVGRQKLVKCYQSTSAVINRASIRLANFSNAHSDSREDGHASSTGGKQVTAWDNLILEAIKKIRDQKQQPSFNRIYDCLRITKSAELERQTLPTVYAPIEYALDLFKQLQCHLNEAVMNGVLLKVLSKGQIMYKTRLKALERILDLRSTTSRQKQNQLVLRALKELNEVLSFSHYETPSLQSVSTDQNQTGFTLEEITEYIRYSHVIQYSSSISPDERTKLKMLNEVVKAGVTETVGIGLVEVQSDGYYKFKTKANCGSKISSANAKKKSKPAKM